VISIIALLLSILIPSLATARKLAMSTKCKASCRQLAIGMNLYYNEEGNYPAHQWRLGDADDTRVRWFNAMADMLAGYEVQNCPQTDDWEVGRNNSYGYNYKYLGSTRDNCQSPYRPYEAFPIRSIRAPTETIAFADTDGTGWTEEHANGINNVNMFGNHGYCLDPTYIPKYSLTTTSGGELEPYAWHNYRTYISERHLEKSNAAFVDGHVEEITPKQVYADNRYWNGLGRENPNVDRHVEYRFLDGEWRWPDLES
jgi:prepilin-type processing-associated H-X9-DG protein